MSNSVLIWKEIAGTMRKVFVNVSMCGCVCVRAGKVNFEIQFPKVCSNFINVNMLNNRLLLLPPSLPATPPAHLQFLHLLTILFSAVIVIQYCLLYRNQRDRHIMPCNHCVHTYTGTAKQFAGNEYESLFMTSAFGETFKHHFCYCIDGSDSTTTSTTTAPTHPCSPATPLPQPSAFHYLFAWQSCRPHVSVRI